MKTTPNLGDKVRLISFSDIAEKDDFSKLDGLELDHFIQLKGQNGYFHSLNKFEPYIPDDPPINIQWDGKCFIVDDIRIDPIVLKEILSCYVFDENGNATDVRDQE